MFAVGFVLVVLGVFFIKCFGTNTKGTHNSWDVLGTALFFGGFFSFLGGVFSVMWDYLP